MVRGVKETTPVDPAERAAYRLRRDKNNQSAHKHRERTKQMLDEGRELKRKFSSLMHERDQLKEKLTEIENQKHQLLEYLLSHNCASSEEKRKQLYNQFCRSNQSPEGTDRSDQSSPPNRPMSSLEVATGCSCKPRATSVLPLLQKKNRLSDYYGVPSQGDFTAPYSSPYSNQQLTTQMNELTCISPNFGLTPSLFPYESSAPMMGYLPPLNQYQSDSSAQNAVSPETLRLVEQLIAASKQARQQTSPANDAILLPTHSCDQLFTANYAQL